MREREAMMWVLCVRGGPWVGGVCVRVTTVCTRALALWRLDAGWVRAVCAWVVPTGPFTAIYGVCRPKEKKHIRPPPSLILSPLHSLAGHTASWFLARRLSLLTPSSQQQHTHHTQCTTAQQEEVRISHSCLCLSNSLLALHTLINPPQELVAAKATFG